MIKELCVIIDEMVGQFILACISPEWFERKR